jgi:hypothetical protein
LRYNRQVMARTFVILAVFVVTSAAGSLLSASPSAPPARFEPCTIVDGETKSCAGFTTGEVVFSEESETKPHIKNPILHRCQCSRGLIRKCQSVPFDGWTVRQNVVDGKYYECKVEMGVVGECKKKPYTGEADLVICVASTCAPPFPKSGAK